MGPDTVTNIENIKYEKTSIAKVLLIFYVLIASNYTDTLISKQMRDYIKSDRLVQHIIGFFMMVILVSVVGGVVDTKSIILYSAISYVLFLFTTKLDIHWNVIILILLFIGYLFENSFNVEDEQTRLDPNISDEQKLAITQTNNVYKTYIVCIIAIVALIGTLFYSHKKHEQYGGGFDIFAYMLY